MKLDFTTSQIDQQVEQVIEDVQEDSEEGSEDASEIIPVHSGPSEKTK